MNDPEIEALTGPAPEYWDLANALVGLREWLHFCGPTQSKGPVLIAEEGFGIVKMEERIRRALASGKMRGYSQEGSEFIELPRSLWKNDTAWKGILMGMPLGIGTETNESWSRVFVKFDEVLAFGLPVAEELLQKCFAST